MNLVRLNDRKNFASGLLLPSAALQDTYFTLRAFNVETAMIKDSMKGNEQAGRLRIAWWRDVLERAYDPNSSLPNHPVGIALRERVAGGNLKRRWLERMLDAREDNLMRPEGSMGLAELEEYSSRTQGALLHLGLESLEVADDATDHAAEHLARCIGIVTCLFAMPFLCHSSQVNLPRDVLQNHDLTHSEVLSYAAAQFAKAKITNKDRITEVEKINQKLTEAVFETASRAHGHLEEAKELFPNISQKAHLAFLPAVPAAVYLQRLEQCSFQIFNPMLLRVELDGYQYLRILKYRYFTSL